MIRIQLPAGRGRAPRSRLFRSTDRPQAPGPPPDRPAGPPGPARTRTSPPTWASTAAPSSAGSTPTCERRPRRPAAPQGQGQAPADPRRPGRRDPPLGHRGAGRAGAGPGQLDPRGAGRPPVQDPRHPDLPQSAMQRFCRKHRHPPVPADLPLPAGRPGEAGRGPGGAGRAEKGAEAGELVLLSQDEARFPMVPTLGGDAGGQGAPAGGRARGTARTCCTSSPWSTWSRRRCTPTRWRARKDAKQKTGQEQDPADAGGVRRPPAARRPDVPARRSTSGWC